MRSCYNTELLELLQASVPRAVPQAPQKDQKKKSGPAAVSKPVGASLHYSDVMNLKLPVCYNKTPCAERHRHYR